MSGKCFRATFKKTVVHPTGKSGTFFLLFARSCCSQAVPYLIVLCQKPSFLYVSDQSVLNMRESVPRYSHRAQRVCQMVMKRVACGITTSPRLQVFARFVITRVKNHAVFARSHLSACTSLFLFTGMPPIRGQRYFQEMSFFPSRLDCRQASWQLSYEAKLSRPHGVRLVQAGSMVAGLIVCVVVVRS